MAAGGGLHDHRRTTSGNGAQAGPAIFGVGGARDQLVAQAVDRAYQAAWWGSRALPEPTAARASATAAYLAWRRDGAGVRQLRANLARVLGPSSAAELDLAVQQGMRSYARYWRETFRLPGMDIRKTLAHTRTEHVERLDEQLNRGRGVVLALPHSGNWEVAGLWLVQRGYPFATVAERLRPDALYRRFVAYRESLGMTVLPLTGGGTGPFRHLLQRLRAGGVVCLVADRDLSRSGVHVDFFGGPTRMPPGPAQLALATGAALVPVHTYYTPDGWGQWIGSPIELASSQADAKPATKRDLVAAATQRETVATATQQLADVFAGRIKAYPTDWHMLQPLWLADLDPLRLQSRGD